MYLYDTNIWTQKCFAVLFELYVKSEFVTKELVKCIGLAKDVIHAIIKVLSLKA